MAGAGAFGYWTERLTAAGVPTSAAHELAGFRQLDFEDREGQRLALIDMGELVQLTPGLGAVCPQSIKSVGWGQ